MEPDEKELFEKLKRALSQLHTIESTWKLAEQQMNFNVLSKHYREMLKAAYYTGTAAYMELLNQIVANIDSQDVTDEIKCQTVDAVKEALVKEVEDFLKNSPIFNQISPEVN